MRGAPSAARRAWKPVNELHAAAARIINPSDPWSRVSRSDARACELRERLVYSNEMRPAWEDLGKVIEVKLDDHAKGAVIPKAQIELARCNYAFFFLGECSTAVFEYEQSPKYSPAAHKKAYEQIASLAARLRELVEGDPSLSREVAKRGRHADAKASIRNALIDAKQNGFLDFPDRILERATMEIWITCLDHTLKERSRYLADLADAAREISGRKPMTSRPNKKTSTRNYFVKSVSEFLHRITGKRLHGVVAAAASAAFKESVHPEFVKDLINAERPALKRQAQKK